MQWRPLKRVVGRDLSLDVSLGRYKELAQFKIPVHFAFGAEVKRGVADVRERITMFANSMTCMTLPATIIKNT